MKFAFTGPSQGYIELDRQRLNFYIKTSKHSSTRYRYVLQPGLGLLITKPRRGSAKAALDGLGKQEAWLRKALERNQPSPAMYLGEHLLIVKDSVPATQKGGHILTIPSACTDPQLLVTNWYKAQARAYLEERLPILARQMGVLPARVSIRDQRTRWGSCSSKGTLSFNWRLIMTPAWVFDGIIVHELAHLYELNHSPGFWDIVAKHCPAYGEVKAWLRQNGAGIRAWSFKEDY